MPSMMPSRTTASHSGMSGPRAARAVGASAGDVLAAVDTGDVAGDPVGVGVGEDDDGAGHVIGGGEAAAGIPGDRAVLDRVASGDLLERGGIRHARPDGIGGDAPWGELGGELADV